MLESSSLIGFLFVSFGQRLGSSRVSDLSSTPVDWVGDSGEDLFSQPGKV